MGGPLLGFTGASVIYGKGIGSFFSRQDSFVSPLTKKGCHGQRNLKSAAKNIASDILSHATGKLMRRGCRRFLATRPRIECFKC